MKITRIRALVASFLVLPLLVLVAAPSNAGAKWKPYTLNANSLTPLSTGIKLATGDSITVTASGEACFRNDYSFCLDADGDSLDITWVDFPAEELNGYSLIARVGNGAWQFVGVGPTTIVADTSGTLEFFYNDDNPVDNLNGFSISVSVVYYGYGTGDNNKTHIGPKKLL